MVTKNKVSKRNYFDINSLIAKGKNDVRKWQLPIGEVLYRPISQLEAQEAQAVMLGAIKDVPTREYLVSLSEKNELEEASEVIADVESESDLVNVRNFPPEVNLAELYQAMIKYAIHVVAISIRDYTDDFIERDLMKLDGIRDLSDEILRISGETQETRDDVEGFRE